MAEKGTTAEVLADTKTFLTGSFPLRLTSSGRIASILVSMQLEELGIDYLARRNKFIEQVTLQDVNRLAKTVLDPDNLVVVVVGGIAIRPLEHNSTSDVSRGNLWKLFVRRTVMLRRIVLNLINVPRIINIIVY